MKPDFLIRQHLFETPLGNTEHMDLGELGLSNPILSKFDPILPGSLDFKRVQ